jgi:hypothetical protein
MSDEFDWLDEDDTTGKSVAAPEPKPKKRMRRPHTLLTAKRKLPPKQRVFADLLVELPTIKEAMKAYSAASPNHNESEWTLQKWRNDPAFVEYEAEYRKYMVEVMGFSKEKVILNAEQVREAAMTPKPILYKGEETGYEEVELGAAMRAVEFQGKALGIGGDDRGNVVINLDIDFSGRRSDVVVEGEVVDVD